jgi:hypothetical protein
MFSVAETGFWQLCVCEIVLAAKTFLGFPSNSVHVFENVAKDGSVTHALRRKKNICCTFHISCPILVKFYVENLPVIPSNSHGFCGCGCS